MFFLSLVQNIDCGYLARRFIYIYILELKNLPKKRSVVAQSVEGMALYS